MEKFSPECFDVINGKHIIKSGYDIHHKNRNKLDDSLENLELLTRAEHSRVHVYERFLTKESREKARNTRRINYLRKLGVFKFEKNAGISIIRRISNIVNNTNAQRLLFLNL